MSAPEDEPMATRSRAWIWTLFNYVQSDVDWISVNRSAFLYICYGEEIAPTTGSPHLQGYLVFESARSKRSVLNLLALSNAVRVRKAVGTCQQNVKYCSKDGKFVEFGTRPVGQGSRSDISHVRDMVKRGATMREICDEATSYQSIRTAEIMRKYYPLPERTDAPEIWWFWGPTGTGKSRKAREFPDYWVSMPSRGPGDTWFEGYDGQETVIFDDYRPSHTSLDFLLRLTDRYALRAPVKSTSCPFAPKRIVFTCPWHPKDLAWVSTMHEDPSQFLRRITKIVEFTKSEQDCQNEELAQFKKL